MKAVCEFDRLVRERGLDGLKFADNPWLARTVKMWTEARET